MGFEDRTAAGEILGAGREVFDPLAIEFVGHTHLDRIELIEHIELGDRQAVEAVHLHGVAADHAVEPATAPASAGGGAVFSAAVAKVVIETALQFGRKGTLAHPGGVGLRHADHPVDQGGAHTGTDAGPPRHRVGGGHVGVGAMVEIEQGALGPLKEDVLAGPGGLVDRARAIHHMGSESLAIAGVLGDHRLGIERIEAVDLLQEVVLLGQRAQQPVAQPFGVEQVDHTDTVAIRLVRIGGADAAAGGADAAVAAALFHRLIQQAVIRHGHMGGAGELQALHLNPVAAEHVEFAQHHLGIHHRARSDQTGGVRIENS